MNKRTVSVHRAGDPLPDADDLVWQYGPRGLMLASKRSGEHVLARHPVELATNR